MTLRFGMMAAVAAMVALGAPLKAETLGDALASAYQASGVLDQQRLLLVVADEGVAQAVAKLRPVFSWRADVASGFNNFQLPEFPDWTAALNLNAQVTLYDFGVGALAVEAQKESVLGARAALAQVEQKVLLGAVQAYTTVQSAREFVTLRRNNVRVLEQELQAAKDRFDVGEITRTDVSLSEARLAAARSVLAVAEGDLTQANESYRVAIGHAPGDLQAAPLAQLPASVSAAQAYAVQNHPAIAEAQHAIAAADLTVKRAEAAMKPSVSLSAGARVDEVGTTSGSITLSAGQTFYAGGAIPSGLRQVRAQAESARIGLHLTADSVAQGVVNAYSSLDVVRAAQTSINQQIAAQELAYDGVKQEADAGARTILEVLSAEQGLLDARAQAVSNRAMTINASYSALAAIGQLNVRQLGLNVPVYDVEAHYNFVKSAPGPLSDRGAALDRVLEALQK